MPPSSPRPEPWSAVRHTARHEGPVPALLALHRQAGERTLVHGPGGHALAPTELVRTANRACRQGSSAVREPARETVLTTPPLTELGLVALGCRTEEPPDTATGTATGTATDSGAWNVSLAGLRLGLSERLRDAVLSHLGTRTFGDAPVLQQQLLKGELADATIGHLEVASTLTTSLEHGLDDVELAGLHHRLTSLDGALLPLLGALGFRLPGPGTDTHVSELLADLYVRPVHAREAV